MITVKVLGTGCSNCERLEQIVQKTIDQMAINAEVLKITDFNDILAHGVMNTPGLIIDDQVVSSGRIPSESEIITWLVNALEVNRE
jgi:small redox-active disulfide protein 2